jgi:hypothetical protein
MAAFITGTIQTRRSANGQSSPFADPQYYGAMERNLASIFCILADMPRRAVTDFRVQVIESSGSVQLALNGAHKCLNIVSLRY